ncbi:MAG: lipid-A-disaccharide synthase [Opitutales bacterium]
MAPSFPMPPDFPPPAEGRPDLLVIAGEHSGDQQGAAMVRNLKARNPDLNICAFGGPAMEEAGARMIYDLTQASVVGLVEVLRNYRYFKKLFEKAMNWIERYRPRHICFIDYPGFNLRLATMLFRRGLSRKSGGDIALWYYIGPQVWAWKKKRRFRMAEVLDGVAVIFPFEVVSYRDTDLSVEFVGHPFMALDYKPSLCYDPEGTILLLPGSRSLAVGHILPVLLRAYSCFLRENPDERATVIYPDRQIQSILEREIEKWPDLAPKITIVEKGESVRAKATLTSSGTMSLSCALAGIPGAIAYRVNPLTYLIGRVIVNIPYLGIANLLLGKPMYPEYIQGDATPEALARELHLSLTSKERKERTRKDAETLRETLSIPSAQTVDFWLEKKIKNEH